MSSSSKRRLVVQRSSQGQRRPLPSKYILSDREMLEALGVRALDGITPGRLRRASRKM